MKNIVKYTLAAAASVVMLASCDLNLVPIDAIAYEEGGMLIQTQANLNAFENGILASFRAVQGGVYTTTEEVQFDYFNATIDFGNNYGSIHRCDYTFTTSDYDTEDMWEGHYSVIKNYNIVIANTDNVPDDLKEKAKIVKGEALFFRAASYLTLARHFGPAYSPATKDSPCVPLVLKYDQKEKPSRATVDQVYTQIKADLDEAAGILAGVSGQARSQKPTIDAVNALYARYFMDVKDYANAASYAHKVIDGGKYKLAATAEDMKKEYVNDEGTEAIYQTFASLTEESNSNEYWTNSVADKNGANGHVFRPYFLPTEKLVKAYEPADLRFTTWFSNEETVQIAGTYYTGDFYTFVKYWGNPTLTSSPIRNGRQKPKPFKISEMYLIAAEAELSTDVAAAKADLNALQAARGATLTEATEATVQQEWYKETVGDGFRMWCLKRWGQGFSGRPVQEGCQYVIQSGESYENKQFAANDFHFIWPVPAPEMKINSNLVQNPGYSE